MDVGDVTYTAGHGGSRKSTEKSSLAQEGPAPVAIGGWQGWGRIQESVCHVHGLFLNIAEPLLLATGRDRDWVRRTLSTRFT